MHTDYPEPVLVGGVTIEPSRHGWYRVIGTEDGASAQQMRMPSGPDAAVKRLNVDPVSLSKHRHNMQDGQGLALAITSVSKPAQTEVLTHIVNHLVDADPGYRGRLRRYLQQRIEDGLSRLEERDPYFDSPKIQNENWSDADVKDLSDLRLRRDIRHAERILAALPPSAKGEDVPAERPSIKRTTAERLTSDLKLARAMVKLEQNLKLHGTDNARVEALKEIEQAIGVQRLAPRLVDDNNWRRFISAIPVDYYDGADQQPPPSRDKPAIDVVDLAKRHWSGLVGNARNAGFHLGALSRHYLPGETVAALLENPRALEAKTTSANPSVSGKVEVPPSAQTGNVIRLGFGTG